MRLVLALSILATVAACSAPTVLGDGLDQGDTLPTRHNSGDDDSSGDDDDDSTTQKKTAPIVTPSTTTATTQTDAGLPSKACTITNAALCFTFEDSTADQSADGFQPTVAQGITFVPGHENEAAQFTATSALEFPANAALELPSGAATIEAWIKYETSGADEAVFDDDGRFSLTIQQNGTIICKSSGGSTAGHTVVTTGVWHHVACVVDGGTVNAYLDGNLEGQGSGSIHSNPSLTASIGANAPPGSAEGDQKFLGLIDSFRLLSVARSATDIASDAKN